MRMCRFCRAFLCNCVKMCSRREIFWNMVSNQYEIALEVELHQSDYNFVNALLGGTIPFFSDAPFEHMHFIQISYCIWHIDMVGISLFTPIY